MRQKSLGKTGITVSDISFGCVELGIPYGFTSNSKETMLSTAQAVELLRSAVERGMNFFDTAPAYGSSEQILGEAFHGRRDKVVICTKCSHAILDAQNKLLAPDALEKEIRQSVQGSLKSLGTDYIDVFLSHRVTDELMDTPYVYDIFRQLKKEGCIRVFGLSTYGAAQTQKAIDSGKWDVLQVAYNLFDQSHHDLIHQAAQKGIGVMVRSVLFKGILTDNCPKLHANLKPVQDHYNKIKAILPAGMSLSQLATKFVMSHPGVASTLLGIDRMHYLDAALEICQNPALPSALYEQARRLGYPDIAFLDLPKWDRLGWLK